MKKILLIAVMMAMLACVFALAVSAAPQNYQSYEVELVSGEKITVYQAQAWDPWQGRIWVTDTMYTEAPVDSEGVYPTVDWAEIKVLDFTNAWGHVYNDKTGEHELKRGTNGSMHAYSTGFTRANATNLEKIITGAATLMGGAAFTGLPALKEIVVDNALKEFGWNSFDNNKALTTITIKEGTNLSSFAQQVFLGCTALESFEFPETVTSIGSYVFGNCSSLKTINWPSQVTAIPNDTFNGCTSLEFEIPSWITSIGSSAFKDCDAMVSITVPDGVTSLGGYAFSSCDNLEEIVISDNSLISNRIVGMAEYCPKLASVRIPPLVTDIGYDNFRGCSALSEIIWPNNLLKISGGQNFTNIAIKKFYVPNTVTVIGDSNFTNLEEIRFGASATRLPGTTLNSKALKRVYFSGSIESIANSLLGWSNSGDSSMNITFFCTGTYEDALRIRELAKASIEGTNNAPNMSKLYDAVLVHASEYDETQEPSGFTFVYGYNLCDAFYDGVHAEGTVLNSCQFGCGRNCGKVALLENPQHELVVTKTFGENGYFDACTIIEQCTVCATKTIEEAISALFTSKGVSAKTFGTDIGLVQGYEINKTSIEAYKAYAPDFDFGVLAYANVAGGEVAPKPGDDKVVDIVFDNMANNYIEVKVTGIPANFLNAPIVFCVYAKDGEKFYYLNDGATTESVVGYSYNEIIG